MLADLCFIDQRDDAYVAVQKELHTYGKLGVADPFTRIFGEDRSCRPEVASIFAEQAYRLGYFDGVVTIPTQRVDHIAEVARGYDGEDVTRREVEREWGEPSMVIENRILCYAGEDLERRWVFVDLWPQPLRRYQGFNAANGVALDDPDPFVRALRVGGQPFMAGLTLTAYGKYQRWGPAWWIHHPSPLASEQQTAIAAQLRAIADEDPSQ